RRCGASIPRRERRSGRFPSADHRSMSRSTTGRSGFSSPLVPDSPADRRELHASIRSSRTSSKRSGSGRPDWASARVPLKTHPHPQAIVETIRIRTAGLGFGSGPVQTLATSAGSVWVYTPYPRAEVSRIDTTMNTVAASFDASDPTFGFNSGTAGGVPGASGIAVQKEAVWVGSDLGVIRIAAHLKAVSASLRLGVVIPTALAVDEHTIWVVGRPGFRAGPPGGGGVGPLTRINAATNSVEATIPIGGNPTAIAIGEGSVWIADPGTRSVVRVDPRKNRVAERIRIGGRPRGITVGDGLVWISVG